MKILGISPYHDSSVCLIENGKLLSFYKEERLSKIKRDMYPFLSIDRILEEAGPADIAVICSPSNGDYTLAPIKQYLNKKHGINIIEDISHEHHLQHASLAFYNSKFKKSLVFVIDRNGSFLNPECRESETVFIAEYPDSFTPIYKSYWVSDMKFASSSLNDAQEKFKNYTTNITVDIQSTHGIVKTYESATTLIKQHPLENGKVMGLSSYGKYNKEYDDLFINENIGNYKKLSTENIDNFHASTNPSIQSYSKKEITEENYKFYADYSYAVQTQSQEAALKLIKKWTDITGITDVCVTGGYGLNVVANGFYQQHLPNINFYFEPLADDTGNSVGGAMLYYRSKTKNSNVFNLKNTFFHGIEHPLDEVDGKPIDIDQIVNLLIQQKTLAIYYKQAEAGPRALGHRSIIFDARNKDAKRIVNEIKKREWYRPFAAVMLKEDAEKFFHITDFENSKNMTINFQAKDEANRIIPGILHVDGSCRIQIVTDESEPIFQLLKKFKEKTGVGVLLNTSFNLAGKPLVETPEDAVWTLENSNLHGVWFPNKQVILFNSIYEGLD